MERVHIMVECSDKEGVMGRFKSKKNSKSDVILSEVFSFESEVITHNPSLS